MASISNSQPMILADAHVHLHPCFDVWQVLEAARRNFQAVARRSRDGDGYIGVLLLTEIHSEHRFETLYRDAAASLDAPLADPLGKWSLHQTQEPLSLLAEHADGDRVLLLAGRQIVTQEKLEVLALITNQRFKEGLPLPDTLEAVCAAGGVPVLPWGVGKWIGRRGRLLRKALESEAVTTLHLGDNSGRPLFWPRPSYFRVAEQKGRRVLPGTDPLPLSSESDRPGRFGFTLEAPLDLNRPGEAMKALLVDPNRVMQPYGRLETPLRFLWNQFSLRYQKFV